MGSGVDRSWAGSSTSTTRQPETADQAPWPRFGIRHPDPAAGRASARRPRPQADMAMGFHDRRDRCRCGPLVAGVPAPLRPRTHLPAVQTDPGLDPPEDPTPAAADRWTWLIITAPHPTAAGPTSRRRPTLALGTPRHPEPTDPGPGLSVACLGTSARAPRYRPQHRNPAGPVPDAHPVPQPTLRDQPLRRQDRQTRPNSHCPPATNRLKIKFRPRTAPR